MKKLETNMNFIKQIVYLILLLTSCNHKKGEDFSKMYPPYRLINVFSERIKKETGLVLYSYGINCGLPKNYQYINGVANFLVSYALRQKKNDIISLDFARNLIVFITENLLKEINSNLDVRPGLDIYPLTSDFLKITIYFEDENKIDLGQGVSAVSLYEGKIKYKRYEIYEYTGRFPARGKHFVMHKETYSEALDHLKKQGVCIGNMLSIKH